MKLLCAVLISFLYILLAPSVNLALSLSAPAGTLQQAFSNIKQAQVENVSTLDPPDTKQDQGAVASTMAAHSQNSNNIVAPVEAAASTTSTSFPASSTSSVPALSGRVSPPPVPTQAQTSAPVIVDPILPPQASHESPPSQVSSACSIPPLTSSTSPPSGAHMSGAAVTVSSVPSSGSNGSTVPASEQQPFSVAVTSSQANSSIHAPQHTHQSSPPTSSTSQSQVQVQSLESEAADLLSKSAGRDDIQALDKKLRSLFKDQSAASASMDSSQPTGTTSPTPGTVSPPPGLVMVPPTTLPLTPGVQAVLGSTTTPGQGLTPSGHIHTPPTKPRAQVGENCIILYLQYFSCSPFNQPS